MSELKIGMPIFTKNDSEFDVYVTKINGSRITVEWEDECSNEQKTQVLSKSEINKEGNGEDVFYSLPNWTCT